MAAAAAVADEEQLPGGLARGVGHPHQGNVALGCLQRNPTYYSGGGAETESTYGKAWRRPTIRAQQQQPYKSDLEHVRSC